MKYLVSVAPEATGKDMEHNWAPEGEPVVPWYPATLENFFLSAISFKQSPLAKVVNTNADPDELAANLAKQYPGLPLQLHQNYILETARAACLFPLNTIVRIYIDRNSARLQAINSENIITMWEKQPL